MYYAIAYDIASDRRRRKVLDKLKNYGLRVQLSVVECDLDPPRLEKLKADVLPLLNRRKDRLRIYTLCQSCYFRSEIFGPGDPL
jgi:CRISPR-associated protein Cas2